MPLRVALVHPYAWPAMRRGGERLLDDLAWYLHTAGHRADVITGTHGASLYRIGDSRSLRLHHPRLKRLSRIGITPLETFGLRALGPLLFQRYDAVHALLPAAALGARLAGQPTVYTVLGHPGPEDRPEHWIRRQTLRWATRVSSEVVVLSNSAARSFEALLGRRPRILPPGVRLDRFQARLEPRQGPPRILFAGSLSSRYKGLDTVVAAFEAILASFPDARLQLSGPGDATWATSRASPAVASAIDLLGTGSLEDVAERYRAAHVTVLPSEREAFGLVLAESLACGTPVVGGKPGGAEDIIDDPAVGRLVEPRKPAALATTIAECIELSARHETPSRCRSHAERWDWSRVGPLYEELYCSTRK